MPDIFLSYNREDQAVARQFADAFKAQGFDVWWDAALRAGEAYDKVTEQALSDAKAVVVLWSKKSVESRWVRAEATQADRNGTLVPVMIEPCKRPIMFDLTQTAELSHWRGAADDMAWTAFLQDLKRMILQRPAWTESSIGDSKSKLKPSVHELLDGNQDQISVAVLPFSTSRGNPDSEAFADGLSDDLITALSRMSGFFVIGRASSFTYKGRSTDVRQIGRELGVQYVLDGTARLNDSRLRVTAQLVDTATGSALWADKFDRAIDDIFEVQDEITAAISSSSQTQVHLHAGRTQSVAAIAPNAWLLIMRSWNALYRQTPQDCLEAQDLAEQARKLGSGGSRAREVLALALAHRVVFESVEDPMQALFRAKSEAQAAVNASDSTEYSFWALGLTEFLLGNHGDAVALLRMGLDRNANCSLIHGTLGNAYALLGQHEESIASTQLCIRMNPRDPSIFHRYHAFAAAGFAKQDYPSMYKWASKCVLAKPEYFSGHLYLVVAAQSLGRQAEAIEIWNRFKQQTPDVERFSSYDGLFVRTEDKSRFVGKLREIIG